MFLKLSRLVVTENNGYEQLYSKYNRVLLGRDAQTLAMTE
jgi:hypothetical protein